MGFAKKLAMFVLICCVAQEQGAAASTFNFSKGALGCDIRLRFPEGLRRALLCAALKREVVSIMQGCLGCGLGYVYLVIIICLSGKQLQRRLLI